MIRRILLCALATLPLLAAERPWKTTLGAGFTLTSGNTNTRNYNLSFGTRHNASPQLLFKADLLYLLGSSNGTRQLDKATADLREELTVSDRDFAFAEVAYLRDPFKGISYSVAPVLGAGRRMFKTARQTLSLDGATGALFGRESDIGRTTGASLKAGENYEWAISSSSKLTQKATAIWKMSDLSDSLYHFDSALTTAIASRAELKVAYNYDLKNRQTSAAVKKADSTLFAAVLFKF